MKKNIRNIRWHLAKKRWAKSRSEFFYDLRQNIKAFQKGFKHFFVKSKYERNAKTKAPVYTLLILLFVIGVSYSSYKAAPRVWYQYKANELFSESQKSFSVGDFEQAFWNAYTSYHYELKGHRYENLNLLALSARNVGNFESLRFLRELAQHEKANDSDSILYIRTALDQNDHDAAAEHFKKIEDLAKNNPEVQLLQLRILAKNWRKNHDEVLKQARELVHEHKLQDPALDYIYLNIALRSKDYSKEAIAYLIQLTQKEDLSCLIALRKAIQPRAFNKFSPEQKSGFLFEYIKHPLATKEDRIIAFKEAFKMQLIPHSELDIFINKEFLFGKDPANLKTKDIAGLLDFLKNINLPHKILGIIPIDVALRNKAFLVDYVIIMMNSGKLDEAYELIRGSSTMFSKSERYILEGVYRMIQSEQEGGVTDQSPKPFAGILAGSNQSSVLNHSESEMSSHYFLFDTGLHKAGSLEFEIIERLIDRIPANEQLIPYLEKMASDPSYGTIARILLLKLQSKSGLEGDLLAKLKDIGTELSGLKPEYLELVLYLKKLYRLDDEETLTTLEQEASKEGSSMDIVIDLSLAYFLSNQAAKAFQTLEEVFPHYHLFRRPGSRVIAALVYDANQQPDSNLFLQTLNLEALLPPERKLVSRLLQTDALGIQDP
jgi:hypothetical protein